MGFFVYNRFPERESGFFMAKIDAAENIQAVIEQNKKDALDALQHLYAKPCQQMALFEEFAACKETPNKHHKNTLGFTLQDESYARFRALGYSQVESWRMAHPQSHASRETMYGKACRVEKKDKIQARILFWKEKISQECLMSTTELFARITEIARERGKEQLEALKMIGNIHGVFKAEKGLPGSKDNPLVVQRVDFSAVEEENKAPKKIRFTGECITADVTDFGAQEITGG